MTDKANKNTQLDAMQCTITNKESLVYKVYYELKV